MSRYGNMYWRLRPVQVVILAWSSKRWVNNKLMKHFLTALKTNMDVMRTPFSRKTCTICVLGQTKSVSFQSEGITSSGKLSPKTKREDNRGGYRHRSWTEPNMFRFSSSGIAEGNANNENMILTKIFFRTIAARGGRDTTFCAPSLPHLPRFVGTGRSAFRGSSSRHIVHQSKCAMHIAWKTMDHCEPPLTSRDTVK